MESSEIPDASLLLLYYWIKFLFNTGPLKKDVKEAQSLTISVRHITIIIKFNDKIMY